jgi:8-oxo-dGTP diphosphatase
MQREFTKVGLAIIRGGRILLVQKHRLKTYILPGGKPELDEDDLATLRREITEELGCGIQSGSLTFLGTFSDQAADAPDSIVTVRLYAGELCGTPSPHAEIKHLLWFSPSVHSEQRLAPSLVNSILPFLTQCRLLPLTTSVAHEHA